VEVEAENLESIHNHSAWGRIVWRRERSDGERPGAAASAAVAARSPSDRSALAEPPAVGAEPAPAVTFGGWLRRRRTARRMSQRALAAAAGVSPSLLSRVECGEKRLSPEAAARVAAALGEDPTVLRLRAGALPDAAIKKIQQDPEGFLRWLQQTVSGTQ
jgi:transcriptional regulator with XRE-family HTH domain